MTDAERALKENEVGTYYMDRRNFIGAINRFKTVVTRYPSSPQVAEALFHLAECYLTLGIVQKPRPLQQCSIANSRIVPGVPKRSIC
jgi:outer membrane protein assembly factor BamD (BamD/ComL family)